MKRIAIITRAPGENRRRPKRASLLLCGLLLGCVAVFCMADGYFKQDKLAATVAAPNLVAVSNAPVTIFSTNASVTDGRILSRTIQNVGTNPVLWLINSTNVSNTNYDGVIAAGTTNRDGKGGTLDVSSIPYPISLITESTAGTTVSAVELTQ